MTAYVQDQDTDPDWAVIAQAEGILAARHRVSIAHAVATLRTEADALRVPVGRLAEDLVGRAGGPGGTVLPGTVRPVSPPWSDPDVDLDLVEETALQEEIRLRRPEPLDLDAVTEAHLRALLR
jgi:hypothetical protein